MNQPTRGSIARRALAGALVLGLFGDALLRVEWGIGLSIWVVALAAVAGALVVARDGRLPREPLLWLAVAALAGLAFVARALEPLQFLVVLAAVVAFGLARMTAVRDPAATVLAATPGNIVVAGIRLVIDALTGLPRLLFRDAAPWTGRGTSTSAVRTAVAAAAAAVLLVVFGSLLAGADPVFASWVSWDIRSLVQHAVLTGVLTWIAAGGLRGGLFPWDIRLERTAGAAFALRTVEVAVVLGSLAALFTLFVAAQFAWIVGGAEFVRNTTTLTLAQFARRGFFQLMWVAILLLPLLVGVRALVDPTNRRATEWYARLAFVLVALFAIIALSAAAKLRLYVSFYGWSTARLFGAAAIAWFTLVFAWFVLTLARRIEHRFAGGVIVSAFAVLALLYAINPDAVVARYNLSHPLPPTASEDPIDWRYLGTLSADAAPVVVPRLLREPPVSVGTRVPRDANHPCVLARAMVERWHGAAPDWRSWNASEDRARRIVRRHLPALRLRACEALPRDGGVQRAPAERRSER